MPATSSVLAADLRQAVGRTHRRLRAEMGDAGLSYVQYSALVALTREGAITPGRLAEREGVQPPTMTRTVNCLVKLGLVSKTDDPHDGRQVLVALTPAGEAEVDETRRRRDVWLTSRLARLTPDDRAALTRAAALLKQIAAS
ncbi:MAG: MarR family transcriptional regulator [Micrococcales bacterium]|nr:MarR family transcriptional regulator [Micrococcales bacterium]